MDKQNTSLIFGTTIATLNFLFFCALVILSIFGKSVPCEDRYLVILLLSIGLGLSASILTGNINLMGGINIPWVQRNPLKFRAAGGFAIIVFTFVVGQYLYIERAKCKASKSDPLITSYLAEAKDVERDWLETFENKAQCNQLSGRIEVVLAKLQATPTSDASPQHKIRRLFMASRLNYFLSTLTPNNAAANQRIAEANQLIEQARELGDALVADPDQNKADFDWYFRSKYEARIISNKLFYETKKYAISKDRAHLEEAARYYETLKAKYSEFLKQTSPMEDNYLAVIKSGGKTALKQICLT